MWPILALAALAVAAKYSPDVGKRKVDVQSMSDVTPSLLRDHGLVYVKEDNSVIVADFYYAMAEDPNFEAQMDWVHNKTGSVYIQTEFAPDPVDTTTSEWEPIAGCYDNSHSDTVTTITRAYHGAYGSLYGPHIYFSVLGNAATESVRGAYSHIVTEQIACDVEPGDTLQLQRQTETVCLHVVRTRTIERTRRVFAQKLDYGEWQDEDETICFANHKLACVTDAALLQCE